MNANAKPEVAASSSRRTPSRAPSAISAPKASNPQATQRASKLNSSGASGNSVANAMKTAKEPVPPAKLAGTTGASAVKSSGRTKYRPA